MKYMCDFDGVPRSTQKRLKGLIAQACDTSLSPAENSRLSATHGSLFLSSNHLPTRVMVLAYAIKAFESEPDIVAPLKKELSLIAAYKPNRFPEGPVVEAVVNTLRSDLYSMFSRLLNEQEYSKARELLHNAPRVILTKNLWAVQQVLDFMLEDAPLYKSLHQSLPWIGEEFDATFCANLLGSIERSSQELNKDRLYGKLFKRVNKLEKVLLILDIVRKIFDTKREFYAVRNRIATACNKSIESGAVTEVLKSDRSDLEKQEWCAEHATKYSKDARCRMRAALHTTDNTAQARSHIATAIALQPINGTYHYQASVLLMNENKLLQAAATAKNAFRLDPFSNRYREHLHTLIKKLRAKQAQIKKTL